VLVFGIFEMGSSPRTRRQKMQSSMGVSGGVVFWWAAPGSLRSASARRRLRSFCQLRRRLSAWA
jgi:hypothetical protein